MENLNKKQLDNNGTAIVSGFRISKHPVLLICFFLFFFSRETYAQAGYFWNYDNNNYGYACQDAMEIDYDNNNDGMLRGDVTNNNPSFDARGGLIFGDKSSKEGIASNRKSSGGIGPTNGLNFITANTPRMVIANNGNVGIGTTTPGFPLNFANAVGDKISLYYNSGNSYGFGIRGYQLQIHTDFIGSDVVFGYGSSSSDTSLTETMRIKGNGNVGIGTPTPGFPLNFANAVGDKISLYGNSGNNYGFGIRGYQLQIHTDFIGSDVVFGYGSSSSDTSLTETMRIKGNGNVGIGTPNPGSYKLAVEGKIGAREVEVKTGSWADFVFDKEYKLKSLKEVEHYIATHKHLPDVPSEATVKKDGINVAKMDAILLQKIEELTLYLIEQNKQIDSLKKEIETLKSNKR
ncbi:hypothetical protein [Chryseobacterium profundimaris]|uniref:Peptidase S74 domain-containing protein n=1 Tax=Chryseobacterium profundimaris TaxID=1387275 RepID=A0ABY1NAV4_9FLAO|nr:hypothetical protein [Chryseobacterium profundimaris]SMP05155.1 hypothetical protein SAMN06264346_101381 [Chryseobacterium profundimaris]